MRTLIVMFLLVLVISCLGGCVSREAYLLKEKDYNQCAWELKKKTGEADKCLAELKQRTQEAELLDASLRRKTDESDILRKELSGAQTDLSALRKEHDGLAATHAQAVSERSDFQGRYKTQLAVSEELKAQNEKLNNLLQSKEISQNEVIKETMAINKELQETNTSLRESLAVREAEARQMTAQRDTAVAERDRQAAEIEAERGRRASEVATLQGRVDELNRLREEEISRLKLAHDELVKGLQSEIEAGAIQIRQMKDRLSVNMVEKILFDSGKAEIKTTGIAILDKVGKELAKIANRRIQIEGHTDNVPISGKLKDRFPTNWELSSARAMSVVRFLQEKVGIEPSRLSGAAYGEYQPATGNDAPEGRAANRRIDIVLLAPYEKAAE